MASLPAFAVLLPSAWAAFQALARAPAPAASAPPERVSLPLPATMTSLPAAASRPSRSATASFVTVALPPVGSLLAASPRSDEHTSELQSLMRISDAAFCLNQHKNQPKL